MSGGGDSELLTVSELHGNIKLHGRRFIAIAIAFYLCVPTFYYWAGLGWEPMNAYYVRTCRDRNYYIIDVIFCSLSFWVVFLYFTNMLCASYTCSLLLSHFLLLDMEMLYLQQEIKR